MLRESTHSCEPTHSADVPSAGGQLGGGCPGESEDQAGTTRAALMGAGASAETRVALASASAALRVVRQKAVGLTSDDQASVMDKVIHQQRMELQQLRQEKAALEQRSSQQASLRDRGDAAPSCATEKTSVGDSSGVALGRAGDSWDAGAQTATLDWRGLRVDKVLQRVRSPRKAAAWCAIVVLGVALFVRMQRRIDQVGSMDATQFDLSVEHSEMEKLLNQLMKDKALLLKDKRNASSAESGRAARAGAVGTGGGADDSKSARRKQAMERHLKTLRGLLQGMHRRHLQASD